MNIIHNGINLTVKVISRVSLGDYWFQLVAPNGDTYETDRGVLPGWVPPNKHGEANCTIALNWAAPFMSITWLENGGGYRHANAHLYIQATLDKIDRTQKPKPEEVKAIDPPRYCIYRAEPYKYFYVKVFHNGNPIDHLDGTYTGWETWSEESAEQICTVLDDLSDPLAVRNFIRVLGLEKS